MTDFNEYSHKGSILMQQALKKLADGDVEGFEKDREQANRFFDQAMKLIEMNGANIDLAANNLYGESRNFGVIYNTIEQNMDKLLETEKGKKVIKEVYDVIKGNKLLNEQFKIYDLFEKSNNVDNAKEFVNEALSVVRNFNKNDIIKTNNKLINIIRKNKLDEYVDIPENVENLYEAIEYVILNKKTIDNVNDFIKAQNAIVEYVENNKNSIIIENKTNNKEIFNEFNNKVKDEEKKIDENINEEERKLIEAFINPKNKRKKIFEDYKKKTLSKLTETIEKSEESDKEGWKQIYESVKNKTYSDKMSDNIVKCAEMMEICSTIDE